MALGPRGVKMRRNMPVTSLHGLVVIFWLYFNLNFIEKFNYSRVGTSYLEYRISVNVKWKFIRYPIFLNLPTSDISKFAMCNRYNIQYLEKSRYLPISDIAKNRYAISVADPSPGIVIFNIPFIFSKLTDLSLSTLLQKPLPPQTLAVSHLFSVGCSTVLELSSQAWVSLCPKELISC